MGIVQTFKFESLVNTEGFQTAKMVGASPDSFESLVNTEGFQTGSTTRYKVI